MNAVERVVGEARGGAPAPTAGVNCRPDDDGGGAAGAAVRDNCVGAEAADGKIDEGKEKKKKKPVVCIIMGMAGSGKTTLLQRLHLYSVERGIRSYFINLDPAVKQVPFGASIDIRDTVNYKEVMSQYGLGPNGAITTSLNLFATRFDQVVGLLEKRSDDLDYIFIDTPGQIEVFTWSASGQIITETLASSFPTMLVYVVDTPRTANATTFMSNMLYACSVLYKSRLPLVLALNKSDILSPKFALEWMSDFEKLQEALDSSGDESYMNSLNRSLALVLDEFYNALTAVSVSAASGDGMPQLFKALDNSALEFERDYLPDLERRVADAKSRQEAAKQRQMEKLMADIAVSSGEKASRIGGKVTKTTSAAQEASTVARTSGSTGTGSGMESAGTEGTEGSRSSGAASLGTSMRTGDRGLEAHEV